MADVHIEVYSVTQLHGDTDDGWRWLRANVAHDPGEVFGRSLTITNERAAIARVQERATADGLTVSGDRA